MMVHSQNTAMVAHTITMSIAKTQLRHAKLNSLLPNTRIYQIFTNAYLKYCTLYVWVQERCNYCVVQPN